MGIDQLINQLMPTLISIAGIMVLFATLKAFINGERGIKLVSIIISGGVILYLIKNIGQMDKVGSIFFKLFLQIVESLKLN